MSYLVKPTVKVVITPNELLRGQMLSVQAYIYDRNNGAALQFKKIYMQIIDSKGVEIWPVTTVAEGTERIDKLISTSQMKPGKYTIRVSPSKKMSPHGYGFFDIKRSLLPLIAIPLIPAVLLAVTSSTKQEKVESTFLEPKLPKIAWLLYQTEKDGKVCPICRPNEGLVFRPDDPDLIRIGPEEFGGGTHWGCRCHYDFWTPEMEMIKFQAQVEEMYEAAEIGIVAMEAMKVLAN